ncbi:alpha/beta fold hydrolase [Antrihabitans stalactiti]|uniref:Alpha/beta fold hydrolase n=1 Tax=Antrihabitans stalactiti TaxID=2584121 RepID=A0A848KKJ1_9NOCA|nr:alpha/beta fold hydrolase [Antrihabitans stalactiti]NMN98388.1 alpha/beta fold hydrolase [Antrihabitans stalactiti]
MTTTETAASALDIRTVPIRGGVELEVGEIGTGDPLVLVCGTTQDLRLWAPLVPALSASRRVILYNHRGIGASTRGAGTLSVRSLADDLDALLEALAIEHADILGWSLGTAVAQELVLAHPDRARSLVLAATWGRTTPFQQAVITALAHPWRTGDWAAALAAMAISFSEEFVNSPGFAPTMAALAPLFPSTDAQMSAVVEQFDADLAHDTLDRLGTITVPTLVIAGEKDLLTPPAEGQTVANAIPGARFELFTGPGASHAVMLERSAEFLAVVTGFLDEVHAGH